MADLRLDDKLGSYVIESRIGEGGQATVYAAIRQGPGGFEKRVALKVLKPRSAGDASLDRLFREARNAALLDHPNIVQVHEVCQAEGHHFLVMDYVDGVTLTALVATSDEPLPPWLGVGVGLDIAQALAHAHGFRHAERCPRGMIHRDVKPSNILVSAGGDVKLADFGLAKVVALTSDELTRVGVVRGTPHYMSPEQLRGSRVSRATDIFSLGVTLYRVLAGRAGEPWNPSRRPAPLRRVAPQVSAALSELLTAAMDPEAPRRPDAPRLVRELERELSSLATSSHRSALRAELGRRVERARQQGAPSRGRRTAAQSSATDDLFAPQVDQRSAEDPSTTAPVVAASGEQQGRWTADDLIEPAGPPTAVRRVDARAPGPSAVGPARRGPDVQRPRRRRVVALLALTGLAIAGFALGSLLVQSAPEQQRGVQAGDAGTSRLVDGPAWVAALPDVSAEQVAIDAVASADASVPTDATADASVPADATADASVPADATADAAGADASTEVVVAGRAWRRRARRRSPRAHKTPRRVATRSGLLSVNADPWGWIYIDGKRIGMTPIYRRPCAVGRHVIRVVGSNGVVRVRRVVVGDKGHTNLGLIDLSR